MPRVADVAQSLPNLCVIMLSRAGSLSIVRVLSLVRALSLSLLFHKKK